MTVGATDPTGSAISFVQVLYRIVQRNLLLVALLVLSTPLGADPWRAPPHCQPGASCTLASDDSPIAAGGHLAVIELAEDLFSDDAIESSDENPLHDAATVQAFHFAIVQAAVESASGIDRRWRALFPDKTGPPRV